MGIGENVGENVGENTGQNRSIILPTYTPLIADNMSTETIGQEYVGPLGTYFTNGTAVITDERSHSGTKSNKVSFTHNSNSFGGGDDLVLDYGPGSTLWYRCYFYFPSTLSFSNAGGHDAWGWGKFLMMCKRGHISPRAYLQLTSQIQLDYGDSGFDQTKTYIINDGSLGNCTSGEDVLPRDQWTALQLAWKISSTGDGWYRAWADDTYLGGCDAPNVPDGYTVATWGIGNYWNGLAWVQGDSTSAFYIDDIIITADQPNTVDSGGRPYIHPSHYPSQF